MDPGGVTGLADIFGRGGISGQYWRLWLDGEDVLVTGRIWDDSLGARSLLRGGGLLAGALAAPLILVAAVLDLAAAHGYGLGRRNLLVNRRSGGGAGDGGADRSFISIKIITVLWLRA